MKFSEKISSAFGPRAYQLLRNDHGISVTQLREWASGESPNGPSAKSWKKLIDAFAKMNVHISPADFYDEEKDTTPKPYFTLNEPLPFPESAKPSDKDALILALTKEKERLGGLLTARDKEILEQKELILKLKAENRKLKKELKELKPN
ncbi:MAG: hypothetical protein LBQ73_11115 [Tannerellaceae bacterium]|nr:hypothetical protein [Tannerellaceae bacterium]